MDDTDIMVYKHTDNQKCLEWDNHISPDYHL